MRNKSAILFIVFITFSFGYSLSQNSRVIFTEPQYNSIEDSLAYEQSFEQFKKFLNSNFDSAYYYAHELCVISLRIGDSLKIVRAYHARGDMQMERGEIDKGIEDMKLALGVAKRNKYDERTKYILNNLAIAYTYKAEFDVALKYNFEVLRLRENTRDTIDSNMTNNNIGLIYLELRDYENSLKHYNKSLVISSKTDDVSSVRVALINMGYCNIGLGDYSEAIKKFNEALALCNYGCDNKDFIMLHYALAKGYLKVGNYYLSEHHAKQSFVLSKTSRDIRHWSGSIRIMAELHLMQNRFEEARALIQEAYALTLGTDIISEHLDNLNLIAVISEASGDYQKSIHYQAEYLNLLREMTNGEMISNFSKVISAFDQRVNLSTIERQKELIKLKEDRASLLEIILITSVIAVLLLILVGVLLWRGMRMKSRINRQLDQKVRHRTAELEESYKKLQKANFEQQENLLRLYSKVRSGMATMKGIAETAKRDVEDGRSLDYISKMEEQAKKIHDISSGIKN